MTARLLRWETAGMEQTAIAPRAYRDGGQRWVAGVASGLAEHLGWSVTWTRFGFVALSFAGGLGIVLYAAYWLFLPLRADGRTGANRELGLLPLLALTALLLGGWLLADAVVPSLSSLGFNTILVIALVVVGLGAAIIWRQADDEQGGTTTAAARWLRVAVGLAMVAVGALLLIADAADPGQALRGLLVGVVVAGGLSLLALPWIRRQWDTANQERAARIRAAERAEVAAQVHDSVLQTLTLIRSNADDAEAVARLSRAEERRLRRWLYEPDADDATTLRSAIDRLAAETEADYPATVEVIAVGDAPMDPALQPLLAAASEALLNAAKHAGGSITLFCEVEPAAISLSVRDRGAGFDPAAIPSDRLGVRASIVGRMERAGGTAEIRATPTGTEVRLALPREEQP
jgi:signal transduction histidine kinase